MNDMPLNTNTFHRRRFLQGTGAVLALPFLESLMPRAARAAASGQPHRMIAIMTDLGMIPEYFFPEGEGTDYRSSRYLDVLKDFRKDMTIFSGVTHPEVVGGHQTDQCFLTGTPHPRKPGFRNTISLDQYAATELGPVTRFPSLTLRVGPSNKSLSYSANGVRIPSEEKPSQVYRRLFVQGSKQEVEQQIQKLKDGQSLMDSFTDRLRTLNRKVGREDKERLDQFFTAFRELEQRLKENEEWEQKPKPEVGEKIPKDVRTPEALVERTRLMYDLSRLALETDSTRLITIFVTQQFNPKVDLPGVELPHHALTHQMSLEESRAQLEIVEKAQFQELGRLLGGLRDAGEKEGNLLDQTMVLYGSNLGNAAKHDNSNLPVLLAGGGFKHGRNLVFDKTNNEPLTNLYLSMLHRLGVPADRFSTSTRPMPGLEMV